MKTTLRLIPLFAVIAASLSGAADPAVDAVSRADDERASATVAGDPARLDAILSGDLHYAHASGAVNDKAGYIGAISSGKSKYLSISYESRDFRAVAPGIVLMTGRAMIRTVSNGQPADNHLSFLAVWREEAGVWRFLAWQSCHLPDEKR
jgi:hypothetical protein